MRSSLRKSKYIAMYLTLFIACEQNWGKLCYPEISSKVNRINIPKKALNNFPIDALATY